MSTLHSMLSSSISGLLAAHPRTRDLSPSANRMFCAAEVEVDSHGPLVVIVCTPKVGMDLADLIQTAHIPRTHPTTSRALGGCLYRLLHSKSEASKSEETPLHPSPTPEPIHAHSQP